MFTRMHRGHNILPHRRRQPSGSSVLTLCSWRRHGTGPGPIVLDVTGTFLFFVLDLTSNQISEFRINITVVDSLTTVASLVPSIPEDDAHLVQARPRWRFTPMVVGRTPPTTRHRTVTVYYLDINWDLDPVNDAVCNQRTAGPDPPSDKRANLRIDQPC